MNTKQTNAILAVTKAVVEACDQPYPGAPGGVLYAALMSSGINLERFQQLMGTLERIRLVEKHGDCYMTTPTGRHFVTH